MSSQQKVEDIYYLTPMQKGMLFLTLSASDGGGVHFNQLTISLKGSINVAIFEEAWQQVVNRHTILRSAFVWEDLVDPLQGIARQITAPFLFQDWGHLSPEEQDKKLATYLNEEREIGFNLTKPPLIRFALIQVDSQQYHFVIHYHHLVLDGWSLLILLEEFFTAYGNLVEGRQPNLGTAYPFRHYVDWLGKQNIIQAEQHWRKLLHGFDSPIQLAADQGHIGGISKPEELAEKHLRFSDEQFAAANDFTRQHKVTLNTLIQGAWSLLLSHHSNTSDVVFGITTAGRSANILGIDKMVGLFINTFPVRVNTASPHSVVDWLKDVQAQQSQSHQYEYTPLNQIQAWSDVTGGIPLFETLFIFDNFHFDKDAFQEKTTDFRVANIDVVDWTSYPLTVEVSADEAALELRLKYDTVRFSEAYIDQLLTQLPLALARMMAEADKRPLQISILADAEREQLLHGWNDTAFAYPQESCFHELFEAQVAKTPNAIAATYLEQKLTYTQLNQRANQLARVLQQKGVQPGMVVAVLSQRGLDFLTTILAIWKVGGAYLPLDPKHPAHRHGQILQQSRAPFAVAATDFQEILQQATKSVGAATQLLDLNHLLTQKADNSDIPTQLSPRHLAYVIFTSGSTGKPKGAMVEQQGMLNHLFAKVKDLNVTAKDKIIQNASQCFDISVWQYLTALLVGGQVRIVPDDVARDHTQLLADVVDEGATILEIVPSLLNVMLDYLADNPMPPLAKLRWLISTGEALPVELCQTWLHYYPHIPLMNAYGPTECSDDVTHHVATKAPDPTVLHMPIGTAVINTQLYILNEDLQPVPMGVPGELYVGGDGVGRGYLFEPGRTAQRFLPNPFHDEAGGRLYKTGDLVRYLPNGEIQFLGRIDYQVKIRGFRIELGEIEAVMRQNPKVREVVVTTYKPSEASPVTLIAYVVQDPANPSDTNELRDAVRQLLPDYMVPSQLIFLEKLPLTANGKVDRKALPDPQQERTAQDVTQVAPRHETEKTILKIWQEVLHIDEIGIHDNFFDLGGHSLLVLQVYQKLTTHFKKQLTVADMFAHTTIASLAEYVNPQKPVATNGRVKAKPIRKPAPVTKTADIAVIGMAGRFPGANNIDAFWQNLRDGVEGIHFFDEAELLDEGIAPDLLHNPNYVPAKGMVENPDHFDAQFFGISPSEAELMDPQQRVFLEVAWHALEDAGYNAIEHDGEIGLYAGAGFNSYLINNILPARQGNITFDPYQAMLSNGREYLATQVSYKLNLRGPSITVQTACSTSLVAVHFACQALINQECDMALAGGITLVSPTREGYLYQVGGILSPDGHCRAFDAQAQGTVNAEGAGIVVLKPLQDALRDGDTIHAVIKGSSVNNDGNKKIGYTAPSVEGQAEVIQKALGQAAINPKTVGYIEAHGTGTALGDPIEIAALTRAYRQYTDDKQFCAIGSVKSNIGHTDAAAGVAGLIKAILALKHRQIPPTLHYTEANPNIDFANSPFYVNDELQAWEANTFPRRAGVSSLGIGGTNAHVIVEEAPAMLPVTDKEGAQLLILSAKHKDVLTEMRTNLAAHLRTQPNTKLADVAYTLQLGRSAFAHRYAVVEQTVDEVVHALETPHAANAIANWTDSANTPLCLMFPGQGSQYVNMGKGLYETEPLFRDVVTQCANILADQANFDLLALLYPTPEMETAASEQLQQTEITQPVLFTISYALAQLWLSWGLQPQAMIGHSIGEYVAACLAGVFTLEDALTLVAKRGQLIQSLPTGSMLSLPLAETAVLPLLKGDDISLATLNAPELSVVSGPDNAIDALQKRLDKEGINYRRLHTSHAFHSMMMEPILEEFTQVVSQLSLQSPHLPFISNVTGTWITPEEATSPAYWASHIRSTVRFEAGMQTLLAELETATFLEVGPGHSLATFAKAHTKQTVTSLRHPKDEADDRAFFLTATGRLWATGVTIDWPSLYQADEIRHRLPLPHYPFQPNAYWITPDPDAVVGTSPTLDTVYKKPDTADWLYLPQWHSTLPLEPSQETKAWLAFVGDEIEEGLIQQLDKAGHLITIVQNGQQFAQLSSNRYTLDSKQATHYEQLLTALAETPSHILYDGTSAFGFDALTYLAQALGSQYLNKIELNILTQHAQQVVADELVVPTQALLYGPAVVIPQEYPHITCRVIDIDAPKQKWRIQQLHQHLVAELNSTPDVHKVAYRGNQRWLQTFAPKRPSLDSTPPLHQKGTYLLTGGLGQIGQYLARYLVERWQANLVLISRSGLPDDGEAWARQHPDAPETKRIQFVESLRAQGSEILVMRADVADEEQMKTAVEQTIQHFGTLNGVMHLAGIANDDAFTSLMELTPTQSQAQFQAKVDGVQVLDKVLKDISLDCCYLFSSLSAVLGGLGFTAYAAANACMDAIVQQHNATDATPWITINWDGWLFEEEAGGLGQEELDMLPQEGMQLFEQILHFGYTTPIIVSTGDLQARLSRWVTPKQTTELIVDEATTQYERPDLRTDYVAPTTETEKQLATVWQKLLGIAQVGIHDSFFELGGHSLMAMQMMSQIREIFRVELAIRQLFEAPTIAELSRSITEIQLGDTIDLDLLEALLLDEESS